MGKGRSKRKRRIKVWHVLVFFLVYLLAAACGFVFFGGLQHLPLPGGGDKAAPGYRAQGPVQALRVEAPGAVNADSMRAHFEGAVAFAKENGYNTLIFQAKTDLGAWWKDDIFPPAADFEAQKADPLALLFQAVEGQDLQVWLEVHPYAGGRAEEDTGGKAAKLLGEAGADPTQGFLATDEAYRALLVESLAALPRKYPVGGFVLGGFGGQVSLGTKTAEFCLSLQAMVEDLHTALAEEGRLVPLSLRFDETGGKLSSGFAAKLCEDGLVTYLLPEMADKVEDMMGRLARVGTKNVLASPLPADKSGLFLFLADRSPAHAGTVLGSWPADERTMSALNTAKSVSTPVDAPLPEGFSLPQLLGVSYPAQNAKLTTNQVFIMGTSDPAQPLLLNGTEVPERATSGIYGVAVDLALGDNSFTLSQGDRSVTLNVVREKPKTTTSDYPEDGTYEAKDGQAVVVTELIASALTDPGNVNTINETFPCGATFRIEESTQVRYNGKTTWAYKLPSGDYVLGNHCRLVSGDGTAGFTGLTATADEKGEWIDFVGTGAPGAYVEYKDERALRLTFYDTAFELPAGFSSTLVQSASVAQNEDGSVTLSMNLAPIWGYSLEYTETGTRLYLKSPPSVSADPLRPLAGVTILLDPGHGDSDAGTPGVLWDTGPWEKDLNLALAQAISYRLQQLGATVHMTRTDDSFPTLQDRLAMAMEMKPDIFLAVHHNAMEPDHDLNGVYGVEGYYYHPYSTPASRQLAQNLVDSVSALTGRDKRKEADFRAFYVTRTTVCPSVLFEYGYAMNPAEFTDVASAEGIYSAAFATAQAIVDTLPG